MSDPWPVGLLSVAMISILLVPRKGCVAWLWNFLGTVITLCIRTPYLLSILVLKFEIVHSATCVPLDVSKILLYV